MIHKFDALNRTSARKIPGARNRYVHLPFEDLKPISDAVRERIWPEKVAGEGLEQERKADARAGSVKKSAGPSMKLVS
jgi:hypothetical protein